MKPITRSVLSAAVGLLIVSVSSVSAPATSYAQSPSGSGKGAYGGASVGVYAEAAEGSSGKAVVGSAIIGYRFNARWAIQGEFGRTGNVFCFLWRIISPRMTDRQLGPLGTPYFGAAERHAPVGVDAPVGVHERAGVAGGQAICDHRQKHT